MRPKYPVQDIAPPPRTRGKRAMSSSPPRERSRFVSGTPMRNKLGASPSASVLAHVRTCAAPKRLLVGGGATVR
ncbi:hypothetical protein LY78DRAFT_663961 [Colletotrichum sublineola]|nr:hypothetical protein LY78DRAFT_663961 [Colletotrichum sublineola]